MRTDGLQKARCSFSSDLHLRHQSWYTHFLLYFHTPKFSPRSYVWVYIYIYPHSIIFPSHSPTSRSLFRRSIRQSCVPICQLRSSPHTSSPLSTAARGPWPPRPYIRMTRYEALGTMLYLKSSAGPLLSGLHDLGVNAHKVLRALACQHRRRQPSGNGREEVVQLRAQEGAAVRAAQ